jgi:hypothetical protein
MLTGRITFADPVVRFHAVTAGTPAGLSRRHRRARPERLHLDDIVLPGRSAYWETDGLVRVKTMGTSGTTTRGTSTSLPSSLRPHRGRPGALPETKTAGTRRYRLCIRAAYVRATRGPLAFVQIK